MKRIHIGTKVKCNIEKDEIGIVYDILLQEGYKPIVYIKYPRGKFKNPIDNSNKWSTHFEKLEIVN